jgi:uncharacterized protein (DUF1499 family)
MTSFHGRRAQRRRLAPRLATAALVLAVIGALVLGSAGLGYRSGWWSLGTAFTILQGSEYLAGGILALSLVAVVVGLARRHWTGVAGALLATLLAAGTAAVPLGIYWAVKAVPPIHDITTDTAAPPEFVALRSVRERTPNGAAYGGATIAAKQEKGYPDIRPLLLPVPPARAFAGAEATARALGWEIDAAVPADGRLEATDTTRWFGFKDDVVVRVSPAPEGSRVDVRSASRIGQSDLGTNARRIRAFLAALPDHIPS